MKIVVDLDDTLFMNDVVINTTKEFGYTFTRSDIKTWNLQEIPQVCKDEIHRRWKDVNYMCTLLPVENSQNIIKQWSIQHQIYCVTSRKKCVEHSTKIMVKHYFPEIIETYVVEGSKINTLKKIKPDLFIDDSPYIVDAIKIGINSIMISNKYTPYNHYLRNSVKWVKSLKDIVI